MADSAADYDDVGLQQVDYVAEPHCQDVGRFAQNFGGEQVALLPRLGQCLAGNLLPIAAS